MSAAGQQNKNNIPRHQRDSATNGDEAESFRPASDHSSRRMIVQLKSSPHKVVVPDPESQLYPTSFNKNEDEEVSHVTRFEAKSLIGKLPSQNEQRIIVDKAATTLFEQDSTIRVPAVEIIENTALKIVGEYGNT